ncbi:hypothetical protein BD413DRAFT_459891, partial [Trametes elegans]
LHSLQRARRTLRLRILWAPNSGKHSITSTSRLLARDAARALVPPSPELPPTVTQAFASLPTSRAVLSKQYDARLLEEWKQRWLESPQGRRCASAVDDTPPTLDVHKLYRGLSRKQCSLLSQLRSGHIGLHAYLARIRAMDSPLCSTCNVPETV